MMSKREEHSHWICWSYNQQKQKPIQEQYKLDMIDSIKKQSGDELKNTITQFIKDDRIDEQMFHLTKFSLVEFSDGTWRYTKEMNSERYKNSVWSKENDELYLKHNSEDFKESTRGKIHDLIEYDMSNEQYLYLFNKIKKKNNHSVLDKHKTFELVEKELMKEVV